jgi:flagellin-like hook-associated protein FlgL
MDSMDADTGIINGAAETVLQFNLTNQNPPKPLEMIFLADISGSMGPYIQNVVLNISSFINSVSTRLNASSWSAKAVGYRLDGSVASPTHTFRAPNGGAFVSSIPDLTSQLTSLRGQVGGGVGGLGESLIDGVYDAINVAGGWQNTDSKKVVIGFTDEPSEPPLQPGVTINGVASQLSSNDVNFYLFTNDPSDTETSQLTSQSGAVVGSLASANTDMSAALNGIVDSLITTELIDFDTLAQYIALNGAKQNRIRNLIDSNALLKNHAAESLGQIQDIDIAQESIQFSRLKILQEAGVAYAAHSNVSKNTYIKLFE